MTTRRLITFIPILFLSISILAQKPCLQAERHIQMMESNPEYLQNHLELEDLILDAQIDHSQFKMMDDPLLTIPVVFHVIHQGGSGNIPNQSIYDAINLLNSAYRNLAPYGPNSGTDINIEFCLANVDPNGIPSTGINRVMSPLADHNSDTEEILLKDLSRWNPYLYMNIWTVPSINNDSIAGYSYLSSAHGFNVDGIVLDAEYISNNNDNIVVLAHEVGHYLNLYHTFEQGCTNSDCLVEGDRVCDTPPDNSVFEAPTCTSVNSCSTDADASNPENPFINDVNDQTQNFLDYSFFNCMYRFTDGQRTRMRTALLNTRSSLLQSPACGISSPLIANFQINGNVCQSSSVSVQNTSTGSPTSFYWSFPGGTPANSTLENPSVSYPFEGNYDITLTVSDGTNTNTITKSNYVNVENCCSGISFTYLNNVSYTSGLVSWSSVTNAASYIMNLREVGESTWTTFTSTDPYLFLTNLSSCTDYEYQIGVNCVNSSTPIYSGIFPFSTIGCTVCPDIEAIYAFNTTNISSLITWDVQSLADNYTLQYKKSSDAQWVEYTNYIPVVFLFFLDPCSSYQFRVRSECDGLAPSLYSDISSFSTDCKDSSSQQAENIGFTLFPNPSNSKINISSSSSTYDDVTGIITDSQGKIIFEFQMQNSSEQIDISMLDAGLYFVNIYSADKTESHKFIKKN